MVGDSILSVILSPRLRWMLLGLATRLRAHAPSSREPEYPRPRLNEAWWRERLAAKRVEMSRRNVCLAFLGDSLTHNWEISGSAPWSQYAAIWDRYYGSRAAANLGYSGDTTANLIWRIRDGEVDIIRPRVVVVLIGINDIITLSKRAEVVVESIIMIIAELDRRIPECRVLLLGLLPSRVFDWASKESARVNILLAERDWSNSRVTYLDIGHALLKENTIDPSLFSDQLTDPPAPILLHPTAPAYILMAKAMEPTLAWLLDNDPFRDNEISDGQT